MQFWKSVAVLLSAFLAAGSGCALAQNFPAKPIRLILPFPPGGPTDILGRLVAQKLQEQIGQSVVADSRPGASGNVGLVTSTVSVVVTAAARVEELTCTIGVRVVRCRYDITSLLPFTPADTTSTS